MKEPDKKDQEKKPTDKKAEEVNAKANGPTEKPPVNETPPPPTLEQQLEALKLEIAEWKNKYALAFANLDNQRKAQEKAFAEALKYRSEGFVEKLMPVLDGFYAALAHKPTEEILKNYLVGFEYLYNQLKTAIETEGVMEIPLKIGDEYNVELMHAIDAEVSEGPEHKVLKIYSKGFKLYDRVLRPAMVVVSKKADPKKEEVQDVKKDAKADEKKKDDKAKPQGSKA